MKTLNPKGFKDNFKMKWCSLCGCRIYYGKETILRPVYEVTQNIMRYGRHPLAPYVSNLMKVMSEALWSCPLCSGKCCLTKYPYNFMDIVDYRLRKAQRIKVCAYAPDFGANDEEN